MGTAANSSIEVIYEDNHLLGVVKPAGVASQSDDSGEPSLHELAQAWLKDKYQKPGNVFVGIVHRLDRPVAGVILFAKTSKAASRLSKQFRERTTRKIYRALVEGTFPSVQGRLAHFHSTVDGNVTVHDEMAGDAKPIALSYRVLKPSRGRSLIEIELETGRKHQIRAQFAHIGHPVVGDTKYGSQQPYVPGSIALVSHSLAFFHPIRSEEWVVVNVPDGLCP